MQSVDYPYDFETNRGSIFPESAEADQEYLREKADAENKAEETVGFLGGIQHGALGTWARIAVSRGEAVDGTALYTPTDDEREEILKAFNYELEPAKAVIRNLKTKDDIPKVIKVIKENLEYAGYEAQAPLLDQLASGLGDAVVDPINLAAGAMTGGLGIAGRMAIGGITNVASGQLREGITGVETSMVMDAITGLALSGIFEGAVPASKYLKNTYMESMGVQSHLAAGKGLTEEFFNNNFVGRRLKTAAGTMYKFTLGKLSPVTIRGMLDDVPLAGSIRGVLNKTFKTEAGIRDSMSSKTLYREYGTSGVTAEELMRNNEDFIERFHQDMQEPLKRIYARGMQDKDISDSLYKIIQGKITEVDPKFKNSINDLNAIAERIKRGIEIARSRDIEIGKYKEGAYDAEFFFPRVYDRNAIADLINSLGMKSTRKAKEALKNRFKKAFLDGVRTDSVYLRKMFEVYKQRLLDELPKEKAASTNVSTKVRKPPEITDKEFWDWLDKEAEADAWGIVDQGEGLRRGLFDKTRPEMPLDPKGRLPWNTANRDPDGFCIDDYRASPLDIFDAYMRRNMGDYIAKKVYDVDGFDGLNELFKKSIDDDLDTSPNLDRKKLEDGMGVLLHRIYGMGIRDYDTDLGFGNAMSEVLRNLTFATANTYMGLLNYTEMSAAVLAQGPMMLIRSIPGLGGLFHRFSKGGMTVEDERMLTDLVFTREPSIRNVWGDVRRRNRNRYGNHRVLADIVSGTQWLANALPTTKFLIASQQNIVDTARGAMLAELVRESKGFRKGLGGFLRKGTKERLNITESQYNNLMKKLDEVFEVDEKGRISFRNSKRGGLPLAEDYDVLRTLRRLGDYAADETILRNHLADTFNWDTRSAPILSLLAQFKSFALRSYSKRLVKAAHRVQEGDALYQGANFSISVALATLGNLGITYARTTGMSEEDREKYFELSLGITPDMDTEEIMENAVASSMLRSSLLAAPALFLNAMGVGTLAKTTSDARALDLDDDEFRLFGQLSFGDAIVQNLPALRTAQNYGNLAINLMNFARINMNPDDVTYEQEQSNLNSLWKSIKRVTPQWGYMTNKPLDWGKDEYTTLE